MKKLLVLTFISLILQGFGQSNSLSVSNKNNPVSEPFPTAVFSRKQAPADKLILNAVLSCTNPAAPNNITPASNLVICSGQTTTLIATGTGTINWFTTATSTIVLGSGTSFVTPTLTAGTYTYFAEADTCANSLTRTGVTFTVNPLPLILVLGANAICTGQSTPLSTLGGATTHTWSTGATTPTISVSPTITTTYSVSGAGANGCVGSATKTITVNALPTVSASSTSALLCSGLTASLSASGAFTYTWSTGMNSNTIVVSPTVTTTYTLTGADPIGCTGVTTITQSVSTCAGINELNKVFFAFNVFPNPNKGVFSLEMGRNENSGAETGEIQLLNSLGEKIYSQTIYPGINTIITNSLPGGIYYYLILNNKHQIAAGKIIIE